MGKVTPESIKKKSWSETNKTRKEEKRKWKEINFQKKLEKQKNKSESSEPPKPAHFRPTIAIALPGSILETAQSPQLRSYLAGQIARAACIFQIDEVIIFDDYSNEAIGKTATIEDSKGVTTIRKSCMQLGRILQFLECPQYLRKQFFPMHEDLSYSGIINPLNAPHHLSVNDDFEFREGVVMNKPVKPGGGSFVNVGLLKEVQVDKLLTPGLRCTVKLLPEKESKKKLKGVIVPPATPRNETGVYWGYEIRLANSLAKVFSQSPYIESYDLTIGTSDKGDSVDEFEPVEYKHALIVFGGVQGLEFALENDDVLDAEDPKLLFDYYLNTCPGQGSRTIRTEEAILVTMAALRPKLNLIK